MRYLAAVLAVTTMPVTAGADPLSDFLFGRPESAGAVQGGGFGSSGFDYYGSGQSADPHRSNIDLKRRSVHDPRDRRVKSAIAQRPQAVVPRPYRTP